MTSVASASPLTIVLDSRKADPGTAVDWTQLLGRPLYCPAGGKWKVALRSITWDDTNAPDLDQNLYVMCTLVADSDLGEDALLPFLARIPPDARTGGITTYTETSTVPGWRTLAGIALTQARVTIKAGTPDGDDLAAGLAPTVVELVFESS